MAQVTENSLPWLQGFLKRFRYGALRAFIDMQNIHEPRIRIERMTLRLQGENSDQTELTGHYLILFFLIQVDQDSSAVTAYLGKLRKLLHELTAIHAERAEIPVDSYHSLSFRVTMAYRIMTIAANIIIADPGHSAMCISELSQEYSACTQGSNQKLSGEQGGLSGLAWSTHTDSYCTCHSMFRKLLPLFLLVFYRLKLA